MKPEDALQQVKISKKSKRLQSLWPAIEVKRAEGVTHAEILRLLNEAGIELTERTYKSYLYRYRKRQRLGVLKRAPGCWAEPTNTQTAAGLQAVTFPAPAEAKKHERPPSFEFNPSGISPELLK